MKIIKPKVVFIAGAMRSGSTLLDMMLSQIDAFCTVGELCYIWERGFTENRLCGCGKPFRECDFWSSVVEHAFGRTSNIGLNEIEQFARSKIRLPGMPKIAFPFLATSEYKSQLLKYRETLSRLYLAIQQASGSRVIVDSSKHPAHGLVLTQIPNIDVYIIHLVRDSRAVAYSWQRPKRVFDVHWKTTYMPTAHPLRSTVSWCTRNFVTHFLAYFNANYQFIRYEDLVNDPKGSLVGILEKIGEPRPELGFLSNSQICLKTTHGLSGNPIRFHKNAMEIRLDSEWRKKMSIGQKRAVTGLTWPLLLKYGYKLRVE